ncbi:MAG: PQQ-binding-like beta-propeller repeat protein [Chthonomonadaceae bacterium]|nr:PQQ-binding-like beta-propeller repeat protein [Chthonomonadaceae bacterium]
MKLSTTALLAIASVTARCQPQTGISADVSHPWPMDHANAARTGQSKFPGALLGQVTWVTRIGGKASSLACDRAGKTYVGVTFNENVWSNELYASALNRDGTVAWRVKVRPYDWGAGQSVFSGPALTIKGSVYMNSGFGELLKFTQSGDLVQTISGNSLAANDTTPAPLPNLDVVHFQVTQLKRVRADGSVVWSSGATSQTDPAVSHFGDVALGGVRSTEPHGSRDVTFFNPDGSLKWSFNSTFGTRTQVCFGPDRTLFANVAGTTAYNPDGTVKWRVGVGGFCVALDGRGRALVPQGRTITALNKDTGATVWTAVLPFPGSIVGGVSIDSGNRIYVTSTDGFVACLDSDGGLVWNTKVCDVFTSQPAIGTDTCVMAAGKNGFFEYNVYRID